MLSADVQGDLVVVMVHGFVAFPLAKSPPEFSHMRIGVFGSVGGLKSFI